MVLVVSFKLYHLTILSKFSYNYSCSHPVYLCSLSFLFTFFIFILCTPYIIASQIHSFPHPFTPQCSNSVLFFSRKTTFWVPTMPWLKIGQHFRKDNTFKLLLYKYMTSTFSLNNTMSMFPCLISVEEKNNLRSFFYYGFFMSYMSQPIYPRLK